MRQRSREIKVSHGFSAFIPIIPTVALLGYCLLYTKDSNLEFFGYVYLELPMDERFANESKSIRFKSGQIPSFGVLFLLFRGVRAMPAKTAMKAENHSREGPINTTIGKSGF